MIYQFIWLASTRHSSKSPNQLVSMYIYNVMNTMFVSYWFIWLECMIFKNFMIPSELSMILIIRLWLHGSCFSDSPINLLKKTSWHHAHLPDCHASTMHVSMIYLLIWFARNTWSHCVQDPKTLLWCQRKWMFGVGQGCGWWKTMLLPCLLPSAVVMPNLK